MAHVSNTRWGRALSMMQKCLGRPNMSVWQFDQQGDHASQFMPIGTTKMACRSERVTQSKSIAEVNVDVGRQRDAVEAWQSLNSQAGPSFGCGVRRTVYGN